MKYYPYKFWISCQNEKQITVYDNDIARTSSIDEAVFIRRIIYLWEKFKCNKEIFIVPKEFAEPVGMSIYIFRKLVKKWEKEKIIETKNKGLPLKKWYKINEDLLAKYLTNLKEKGMKSHLIKFNKISYQKQQVKVTKFDKIYNSNKIRKDNIVGGKPTNLLGIPKKSLNFYEQCSNKLENAIRKNNKLCRKVNKNTWSLCFKNLHQKYNKKKKRIKKVLKWYCNNFGEEYVIRAYSANTFCNKFSNIETSMEIDLKKIETGERKVKYTKKKRK